MDRVSDDILALPIAGLNLTAETLGAQLAPDKPTLVAFLRHYGCMFGREMVRDVRRACETLPDYPIALFVGMGDREETLDYMRPTWPEAPIVCDPDRVLFTAFGLGRGSIGQVFGPSVWACHIRASLKGNFFGRIVGDPWMMPGIFVVEPTTHVVSYRHEFRHQGDHPKWEEIPQLMRPRVQEPPTSPKERTPAVRGSRLAGWSS